MILLIFFFFFYSFIYLFIHLSIFLPKFRSVFGALSNTYDKNFVEKESAAFSRFELVINALLQRPCNAKWTQYFS